MKFTVEIPKKGTCVGSLGWVQNQLDNCKIYIRNGQHNSIAVYVQFSDRDKPELVARTLNDEPQDSYYITRNFQKVIEGDYIVYSQYPIGDEFKFGLFGALTDSAEEAVDEFLLKCSEKLIEYLKTE